MSLCQRHGVPNGPFGKNRIPRHSTDILPALYQIAIAFIQYCQFFFTVQRVQKTAPPNFCYPPD
ncbi:MAG: hypothetical protein AB7S75_06145 [Desulfococcaceae bacterium]